MTYSTTYHINPDKAGDLSFDDWHEGFGDSCDKKYPQHLENEAYMQGWCVRGASRSEALGMKAGYENFGAFLSCENFMSGYQSAQHERHCKRKETLLNFDDS